MAGSRRLWPQLAAFALAGVLLGAVAALVVRDRSPSGSGGDGASPSVVVAAPTTHLPTQVPSAGPEATQRPTDQPTTAPTPRAATSVDAFGRHVGGAIKDGAALLESLRGDAQALDVKAVRSDAAALSAWTAAESSWLDAHPAAACYADVHGEYSSAIDDFGEAAAITQRFTEAFPFANYDDLQRALDLANAGAASMQKAADLIKTVRC